MNKRDLIEAKCQMCGEAFKAKTVRSRFCPSCLVIRHIQTTVEGRRNRKSLEIPNKRKPKHKAAKTKSVGTGRWRSMVGVYRERNASLRLSDAAVAAGVTEPCLNPETTRTEWRR